MVFEMLYKSEELKARIEEEKKLLVFYAQYEEEIQKMTSKREWEKEIDECLDILIELFRLLKE